MEISFILQTCGPQRAKVLWNARLAAADVSTKPSASIFSSQAVLKLIDL